jgi:hypothetical protein
MAKLNELRKGMSETPHAERPEESDITGDIEIVKCQDEEFAWQTLKNKALMPTQGFDVPIPGFMPPSGMSKNITMADYLQSDMLKSMVPKEQFEQLQGALKKLKQQIPQVKQDFKNKGIKFCEGKLFGCKAFYIESPNFTPPPKSASAASSHYDAKGMGMGGGGEASGTGVSMLFEGLDPLPKVKTRYSPAAKTYIGMVYKNFILNGPLMWMIGKLPPGNMPCYSLTQTKEVTSTTREGGVTFTDITIVPVVSTFAREGYAHEEQLEQIYQNIISQLK